MNPSLRFTLRGVLSLLAVLFVVALVPASARAIQLHWAGGATDLSVSSDTQALLVVQADSAEVALPNTWRLQWTADSLGVQFSAFDPSMACLVDTAKVDSIAPPQTPADSAANQITAYFCSSGSNNATTAYFLADLVAGSHGKMKVVALNPTDSTSVLESNQVTYNDGIDGNYAPVILSATSMHSSEQLQVSVVGSGLLGAHTLSVGSADGLWTVPLTLVAQTGSQITATAIVPARLPSAVVKTDGGAGASGLASLMADQLATSDASPTSVDTALYTDPNPSVYPKDFAFYFNTIPTADPQHPWQGLFHLFYIRHFKSSGAEPCIAHAWSYDLRDWNTQDSLDFLPDTTWDIQHVWAPSIIQIGDLYYMFYTGVDGSGNQRIGYVTTPLLDTHPSWSRLRTKVYEAGNTLWADANGSGPYGGAQQFRDPFIMQDPDTAGRYVMYMIGEDKAFHLPNSSVLLGTTVVGVAKNHVGTLDQWWDYGPYRATDSTYVGVAMHPVKWQDCVTPTTPIVESPMAMRDSLTGAWRVFFANANYNCAGTNSTFFISATSGTNAADTTLGHWPGLDNLYTYLGSNNELVGWQAAKHLQVGDKWHFFAAYDGGGIGITQAHWDQSTGKFFIGLPNLAAVGGRGGPAGVRFYLSQFRPGSGDVRFEIESPAYAIPRLVVYDIAGRKILTLTDGRPMQGKREYRWQCRDIGGSSVRSGVYFARLTGVGAPKVLRVPVVR